MRLPMGEKKGRGKILVVVVACQLATTVTDEVLEQWWPANEPSLPKSRVTTSYSDLPSLFEIEETRGLISSSGGSNVSHHHSSMIGGNFWCSR
ncbi:hypothetical protein CRG98_050150 [Punica granatum]|uniref:Uncharacterized protein n=1 Tax=Punica granatum TaxID=22663 RepID=A0A2I0GSJ9_PUNGR|nr:hypothetical protein CRG98_050150 [Punica granatum]